MLELVRERVHSHLKILGLSRIEHILSDTINDAQNRGLSYMDMLDQLLTEEVQAHDDRKLQRILRLARLPMQKTIDEYDFSFQPQLDKRSVMNLFDLDFIKNNENVMLLGPPGVGKSHLAAALAIKAAQSGESIYWISMAALIHKLRKDAQLKRKRRFYRSTMVVIDEVGYMPLSRKDAHLFFEFICWRYEQKSTIMTSNKGFGQWQEVFGDAVIATAILDRVLHHCRVINIEGNSYRLKEFQQNKEQQRKEQESKIEEPEEPLVWPAAENAGSWRLE